MFEAHPYGMYRATEPSATLYRCIIFYRVDIPLIVYLFISWLTFGLFPLFDLYEYVASLNMDVQVLCKHVFSSLGYIPRRRIAGSYGTLISILSNCQPFFQISCTILHSHQQCMKFQFLYVFGNTCVLFLFLLCSHPSGYEMVSHCGFVWISLVANDVEPTNQHLSDKLLCHVHCWLTRAFYEWGSVSGGSSFPYILKILEL